MVRPLDESQGSSPSQGHGSWLMCEVALSVQSEAAGAVGDRDLVRVVG